MNARRAVGQENGRRRDEASRLNPDRHTRPKLLWAGDTPSGECLVGKVCRPSGRGTGSGSTGTRSVPRRSV
jgi:hypothetical protein